jgi:acetylornithine/succinyldiaminopimelate/putrescine aminotransferase
MNAKDIEERYELPVYPRRDIVLVRGKGAKLYDDRGREFIAPPTWEFRISGMAIRQ